MTIFLCEHAGIVLLLLRSVNTSRSPIICGFVFVYTTPHLRTANVCPLSLADQFRVLQRLQLPTCFREGEGIRDTGERILQTNRRFILFLLTEAVTRLDDGFIAISSGRIFGQKSGTGASCCWRSELNTNFVRCLILERTNTAQLQTIPTHVRGGTKG